jgi:hypothetical protein
MSTGGSIGSSSESSGYRLGSGGLFRCGLPDFGQELAEVLIRCRKEIATTQFDTHRLLEQLGRGETAFFDRPVEIFGEVDLHPWHTPNHTHLRQR